MLGSLWREYRLRWKLWRLDRWLDRQFAKTLSDEETSRIGDEYIDKFRRLDNRLLWELTRRRKRQAEFWVVDIPNDSEEPTWWDTPRKGLKHLNHRGVAKAGKLIEIERRDWIRAYASILISILSLLIAMLSLMSRAPR